MDNRDEALLLMLESGQVLDKTSIILLIGILSSRSLGPDTIEGTRFIDMRTDDSRVVALLERRTAAERRAFELVRQSKWYRDNEWPDPPSEISIRMFPDLTFCSWVDHRLDRLNPEPAPL